MEAASIFEFLAPLFVLFLLCPNFSAVSGLERSLSNPEEQISFPRDFHPEGQIDTQKMLNVI